MFDETGTDEKFRDLPMRPEIVGGRQRVILPLEEWGPPLLQGATEALGRVSEDVNTVSPHHAHTPGYPSALRYLWKLRTANREVSEIDRNLEAVVGDEYGWDGNRILLRQIGPLALVDAVGAVDRVVETPPSRAIQQYFDRMHIKEISSLRTRLVQAMERVYTDRGGHFAALKAFINNKVNLDLSQFHHGVITDPVYYTDGRQVENGFVSQEWQLYRLYLEAFMLFYSHGMYGEPRIIAAMNDDPDSFIKDPHFGSQHITFENNGSTVYGIEGIESSEHERYAHLALRDMIPFAQTYIAGVQDGWSKSRQQWQREYEKGVLPLLAPNELRPRRPTGEPVPLLHALNQLHSNLVDNANVIPHEQEVRRARLWRRAKLVGDAIKVLDGVQAQFDEFISANRTDSSDDTPPFLRRKRNSK